MALLETLHRADSKLTTTLKKIDSARLRPPAPGEEEVVEVEPSALKSFFSKVADNVSSGVSTIAHPVKRGAEKISDSFSSSANDVAAFFRRARGVWVWGGLRWVARGGLVAGQAGKRAAVRSASCLSGGGNWVRRRVCSSAPARRG